MLAVLSMFTMAFAADPEGNVEHGEGHMNQTSDHQNMWGNYWQGVRLSIYRVSTGQVLKTQDYSNLSNDQIQNYTLDGQKCNLATYWFGENSKLYYRNGGRLSRAHGSYNVYNFIDSSGKTLQFPLTIIDGNDSTVSGRSTAAAVKDFFRNKAIIEGLAQQFGMSYEEITSEDIKILLEPVAYFRFKGDFYAMTATEAAVFQKTVDAELIYWLGSITAEAMPLAMFLERPDIGIPAYAGGGGQKSAELIIDQMGIGIISFHDIIEGEGGEHGPCCDCDEYCPCKYDDNGKPIDGDCRCYDDPKDNFDHPDKIPCDPDYPDNCLCQLQNLVITKKDDKTGEKLSGAVFNITHSITKQTLTGTTGSDGTVTFKDLHAGTWTIKEIAAPDGYLAPKNNTSVTLTGTDKSITITNTKTDPTPPATGDNIIWGYELTRSFTNDTNFDKQVNYPSNTAPTTTSCSGHSVESGTTISYPSYAVNTDSWVEREAYTSYHTRTVITGYDADGKAITSEEEYSVYHPTIYGWSYDHNDYHNVDYKWVSGDVTVKEATYIGKNSFTENGMGKYKVMHNGGSYLLKFNKDSDYIVSRITNLFKELTEKTWISHRNGGLSSQSQEIKLAGYMGNQNSAYKTFYKTYTGNTPNESTSYASNGSNYNTINGITTKTTHGGSTMGKADREFTYIGCNGGSFPNQQHPSYTDKAATQSYKYSVEGTYKASANSKNTSVTSKSNTSGSNGSVSQVFQAPSNVFNFYPTYRMWYTDTLGSNDGSTAWMLSAGRRTFQATDAIKVEISGGETDVWAPWSRDWVDKYTDGSTYGAETYRGYSVIKSGMVVKAVAQDAKITITAAFNVQDPDYAPAEEKSNVIRMNDAKAKEMEAQVNKIKADLTDTTNIVYGYYSNLWEATSENVVAAHPEADTEIPNECKAWGAVSESPKTRLNITNSFTPNTTESRVVYRGSIDGQVGTLGNLTLNGKTYASSGSRSMMDAYTGTGNTVNSLLDSAIGTNGKRNVRAGAHSQTDTAYGDWYEEYYDGIRVAVYTVVISIPSSDLMTDYTQVHSQISDSTTEMNAYAKAYVNPQSGNTLIPEGMYGIGLCAMQKDQTNVTFGGNTFKQGIIYWPAKLFGVRGSVYDLAQNAPQNYIQLR